jgi:ribosomal protein S27E
MTPLQLNFTSFEVKKEESTKKDDHGMILREIVKESRSMADILRRVGISLTGNNYAWIKKRIRELVIDTSHFYTKKELSRIATSSLRRTSDHFLRVFEIHETLPTAAKLRRSLIEIGVEYKCKICGLLPEWNGMKLTLQVDHIDGNKFDSRSENLRFLCPNCHTQTPTFCGGNLSKKKNRVHCAVCGTVISQTAKICRHCLTEQVKLHGRPECRKVTRPSYVELDYMVSCMPMTRIGEKFGVSSVTVGKWADSYGIQFRKPRKEKVDHKPRLLRSVIDGELWCGGGKHFAPLKNFSKCSSDKLGYYSTCRECRKKEKGRSKKNGDVAESGLLHCPAKAA